MNMQRKILQRYRQLFPNDTLREVSARTGIQITRIFRLFNGKCMKVEELEAFENAVQEKLKENPNFLRLSETLEKASIVLTNDELGKLLEIVERRILARTYGRLYVRPAYKDAIIA